MKIPYGSGLVALACSFFVGCASHAPETPDAAPQTTGYTGHRSFFINSEGRIYRYAWKGL